MPLEPTPPSAPVLPVHGEMQPLAPAVRTVWTIKRSIVVAVVLLGVFGYDVAGLFGDRTLPMGVPTGSVFLLGAAYAFLVPRLRYRFWRFALREEELLLERGIWNRVRTVVPLRRIQHLDVSQDVIEREFEIGKLIVHTAGTRSSDVVLPGLPIAEAERLRDTIKNYVLEDTL